MPKTQILRETRPKPTALRVTLVLAAIGVIVGMLWLVGSSTEEMTSAEVKEAADGLWVLIVVAVVGVIALVAAANEPDEFTREVPEVSQDA